MSTEPEAGLGDGSTPYAGWKPELRAQSEHPKRRTKKKRRGVDGPATVNITSLMDVVTIILVYLLKSMTSGSIDVKDPAVEIPVSASREAPEEATVVLITGPQAKTFVEGRPVMVPNVPAVVVDEKPVLQLDPATYRIPDNLKDAQTGGYLVLPLRDALKQARERQEMAGQITGKEFGGKVVIVADRRTPYRVLTEVLVTCGEAGFGEFKFAIIKAKE